MATRSTSQMVGATIVGGMVGAGLALLFAPRSGKETRQHIHDGMEDMKHRTMDRMDRAKRRIRQGADEAKELKERLAHAARNTGRKAKNEMEELKADSRRKSRQSSVLSAWEEEV